MFALRTRPASYFLPRAVSLRLLHFSTLLENKFMFFHIFSVLVDLCDKVLSPQGVDLRTPQDLTVACTTRVVRPWLRPSFQNEDDQYTRRLG